jgi:hypothetical protein
MQFLINACQNIKHQLRCGKIERPSGLVAKQYVGSLCNRTRNRNPLLLST